MSMARRTFVWKGKPANPNEENPLKWFFRTVVYRGRFGRVEPWNEGDGKVAQRMNFPRQGPGSYTLPVISLDGKVVYSNEERLPNDFIIQKEGTVSGGLYVITFRPGISITKHSILTLTITQQTVWMPWLRYSDRPEFLYDARKGMLDPNATPASAIALCQDIDMEITVPNFEMIGIMTLGGGLLGASAGLAAANIIYSMMDPKLDGYGFVRLISYDEGDLDSTDIEQGVIRRRGPKPVLGYKYWLSWYVVSGDFFSPMPGIIMPGQTVTVEYQLLKYQRMLVSEFFETCLYPFILLGNPKGADGQVAETPLNYRRDIFLRDRVPNTPRLVDRLVHISKQSAITLTNVEQRASVATYGEFESIIDEYNFINPKIKIGKLVRLHGVKFKTINKIDALINRPYGREDDPIVGLYEVDFNNNSTHYRNFAETLKKQFPKLSTDSEIDSIDHAVAKTRVFVLVEDQAASDLEEINTRDLYNLGGKVVNPAFMYATRSFGGGRIVPDTDKSIFNVLNIDYVPDPNFDGSSLLAEREFSRWTSISKDIVDLFLRLKGNPYTWVIVIRGRGADAEEEATKDAYSDYIMKAPDKAWSVQFLPEVANQGTTTYDLSDIRTVPLISLYGISTDPKAIEAPSVVSVLYSEDGEDWSVLTKKLILPDDPKFIYRYSDDFLIPLLKPADYKGNTVELLHMNYPEGGFSRKYVSPKNVTFTLPIFQIPMERHEDSGFPLRSDNFAFQVIRDGELFPYKPHPSDPFVPHPTSAGWVPIYTDGMFQGIRLNQPYSEEKESHIYYVRLVNISAKDVSRIATNPLKRAKKIRIVHNSATSVSIALNQDPSDELTNLEAVGISRSTPRKEEYQELVPGRGLKVYNGHGVTFQPADSEVELARAGRVQGTLHFPFAALDAMYENSLSAEDAPEANGVSYLGHGTEILAETTLGVAPYGQQKLLNFYSSTKIAEDVYEDIKISAFYDATREEHVVIYTKGDNLMYVKSSTMDWTEPYLMRSALAASGNKSAFALRYANYKYEKPLFIGTEKFLDNSKSIRSTQSIPGAVTEKGYVTMYPETKRFVIHFSPPGAEDILVHSIEVSMSEGKNGQFTKVPNQPNTLMDTLVCKLVYATQDNPAEELTYGFSKSLGFVEPKHFYLSAPSIGNRTSLLECPIITNPAYIAFEIIIPVGIDSNEAQVYAETVAKANLGDMGFRIGVISENQIEAGVSAAMLRNNSGETYVFYETKKLFGDDGELMQELKEGHITSMQVISSVDGLTRWTSPKMKQGQIVETKPSDIEKERTRLAEAGYNNIQINALVRAVRRWDRPLNISTLASPTFIFDKMSNSFLIFGFMGPRTNGDLVMWQIHEALLSPIVTFNEIEKFNLGGLSFSTADLDKKVNKSNTVARGIPHQSVAVSFTSSAHMFIVYEDAGGVGRMMFSTDKGYSWKESNITLFKPDSAFKDATNVFIMSDDQSEFFRFFALVKDDSLAGYKLYTYALPHSYFYLTEELEVKQAQAYVDTVPKTLIVGDADTIPESDLLPPAKTVIGNAQKTTGGYTNLSPYTPLADLELSTGGKETHEKDENIKIKHTVSAYIDPYGKIRVYYLNSQMRISCKVSEDSGRTWRTDYGV